MEVGDMKGQKVKVTGYGKLKRKAKLCLHFQIHRGGRDQL